MAAVNGAHRNGRDTASARWRDRCARSGGAGCSGSVREEVKRKGRQFAPQAGAWRGHEPPSPRRGASCRRGSLSAKLIKPASCGGDSVRRRRVRRGGRSGDRDRRKPERGSESESDGCLFPESHRRASRRLCRTLADFSRHWKAGGESKNRGKQGEFASFDGRRDGHGVGVRRRVGVHPDPSGGRGVTVRRQAGGGRSVGHGLPLARLEDRSRVACPVPGPVVGRRPKPDNFKLAEREGFEPSVPV